MSCRHRVAGFVGKEADLPCDGPGAGSSHSACLLFPGGHPARGPGPSAQPVPVEPRIRAEAGAVPERTRHSGSGRKPVLPFQGVTPGREGLPAVSPAGEDTRTVDVDRAASLRGDTWRDGVGLQTSARGLGWQLLGAEKGASGPLDSVLSPR